MQLNAHDPRHWPYIGSVVDYLDERRARSALGERRQRGAPRNIALPWLLSSRRPHPSRNGGPYGAFLDSAYDPVWTEFEGEATRAASYEFEGKITTIRDPYGGVRPGCRFSFSFGGSAPGDVTLDRLDRRRALLQQLDDARRKLDAQAGAGDLDRYQQMAFSLLTSPRTGPALDVQREPVQLRERYGM